MKLDNEAGKHALSFQGKNLVYVGPARLEEQLAVFSYFFQHFYLPRNLEYRALKRYKLADLVQCFAD